MTLIDKIENGSFLYQRLPEFKWYEYILFPLFILKTNDFISNVRAWQDQHKAIIILEKVSE